MSNRLSKDVGYLNQAEQSRQGEVNIEPEEWEGSDNDYQDQETSTFIQYQIQRSVNSSDEITR